MFDTAEQFDTAFAALTGHPGALKWQYNLFKRFATGAFPEGLPSDVVLPTGLGKTSIIGIWALALGCALHARRPFPRRLAYIVDRRVVVDQASAFTDRLIERLFAARADHHDVLHDVANAIVEAGCPDGAGDAVMYASTLRGQRTLDTAWRDDPARPAVIIGTVDMIGSRLLFSAYGRVGPWGRSLEAGLLGQDCLVVLDEAHLSAAFAASLAAVEQATRGGSRPFAVLRAGATMTPVDDLLQRTPGLVSGRQRGRFGTPDDLELGTDALARARVEARKALSTAALATEDSPGLKLASWAVATAERHPGATIGLILNTVKEARACFKQLATAVDADSLAVLTGSMRGIDRDDLVASPRYARFESDRDRAAKPTASAILVATSCVEVGADIDCDHLGTEACAADSLIQRLGRVNRLGSLTEEGQSTVLVVGSAGDESPEERVFARLQDEGAVDASPAKIGRVLLEGEDAARLLAVRVPPPALTAATLDDLAMTSRHPRRPRVDVARWIHGSVDEASIYVEVAWRQELDHVSRPEDAAALLAGWPIAPRESARCPVSEAVALLQAVKARAIKAKSADRVVVFFRFDDVQAAAIDDLPDEPAELRELLWGAAVVLPCSGGGYTGAFVEPTHARPVADVALRSQRPGRVRRRLWLREGVVTSELDATSESIDPATDTADLGEACEDVLPDLLGHGWRVLATAGDARSGVVVVGQTALPEDAEEDSGSLGFAQDVPLDRHLRDARECAITLCDRLGLPDGPVRRAVVEAAGSHDLGKARPWWQRAVGNTGDPPVAKSRRRGFEHRVNQGYRHELGSAADLLRAGPPAGLADDDPALCLHLIAAHHGHARPAFPDSAIGPVATGSIRDAASDAPERYALLQAEHGWWGLAYLEALVKAADVMASKREEKP